MSEIKFERKTVYDYTEQYKARRIIAIKNRFSKVCQEDNTLSEEFKKHISDTNNIYVELKPRYGYEFDTFFSYIDTSYSYDYTSSYCSGSHLSGEIKYTSSGNADTSGIKLVKEYSSYDLQRTGTACYFSTKTQPCHIQFGTAKWENVDVTELYEVTNNDRIPQELKMLADREFEYSDINNCLSVDLLPSYVYNALKRKAVSYESDYRNFKMKISDYSIDKISVKIFPSVCAFDVWVEFNGKIYRQEELKSLDSIQAKGAQSEHFQKYEKEKFFMKDKYDPQRWGNRKIYLFSTILSVLAIAGLVTLLIVCRDIGHEGLYYYYLWNVIGMMAPFAILCGLSIFFIFKFRCVVILDEWTYDPKKSISELCKKMEKTCRVQRREANKWSVIWLVFVLIVTTVLGFYTHYLYKETDNKYFWYTPEIIGVYTGKSQNESVTLTIVSCDENGKVEMIEESSYYSWWDKKTYYAKAQYVGQVTTKNKDELVVKFSFVALLEDPGMGNPDQSYTIKFEGGYQKLRTGNGWTLRVQESE